MSRTKQQQALFASPERQRLAVNEDELKVELGHSLCRLPCQSVVFSCRRLESIGAQVLGGALVEPRDVARMAFKVDSAVGRDLGHKRVPGRVAAGSGCARPHVHPLQLICTAVP